MGYIPIIPEIGKWKLGNYHQLNDNVDYIVPVTYSKTFPFKKVIFLVYKLYLKSMLALFDHTYPMPLDICM